MRSADDVARELDSSVRARLAALTAALGRPLRVLHVGNIANNAYVNAKIMRRYGIEADVLVLDYYHVMGCPEWEEGVIEKLEGTENDPDWGLTQVGDFRRPIWFLQGPPALLAAYLTAKARDNSFAAALWLRLCRANLHTRGATGGWRRHVHHTTRVMWQNRQLVWTYAVDVPQRRVRQVGSAVRQQARAAADHLVARSIGLARRRAGRAARFSSAVARRAAGVSAPVTASASGGAPVVASAGAGAGVTTSRVIADATTSSHATTTRHAPDASHAVERPRPEDSASFQVTADRFREAFAYYDVVQGYAVDGIYPLLAGKEKAYACYEHGTLRDIPFQPDMLGRICACAYQNAPAIFITNTDCVAAADKLGVPKSRQFPIPHGFDSERAANFRAKFGPTCRPHNNPVTFIAPARHHWKQGAYVSWLKGNDVPIRAARLLADQGFDFKIIFVRWGQEVHESAALIAELGVEQHFEWIDAVPKSRLWQYYLSCNGVLDQFVIPAIGGVSFETLAFGRPLFTRIDEPVFKDFFGESPPLLNVHTPEDLAAALAKVIRDPTCYDDIGEAALEWTALYHSSQRIIEVLLDGYSRFIPAAARLKTAPR